LSGYATRGGTRFGANEKTYLKKYCFGYVFRSRYVFFLPTKVLSGSGFVETSPYTHFDFLFCGETMELSTASSIDEGCRNNSPPKPGLSRSSLRLPMLDMPTSDNPPPQQRRQTLGGRGLGREDSARGTGLLGTIRRMSVLDPMQLHPLAHQGDDLTANSPHHVLLVDLFV
jgi:hypothetical protein